MVSRPCASGAPLIGTEEYVSVRAGRQRQADVKGERAELRGERQDGEHGKLMTIYIDFLAKQHCRDWAPRLLDPFGTVVCVEPNEGRRK
jgi:hypothetical protein